MMTIRKLRRAQRSYYFFMAFNVISISCLAGNILFLYAIRLGAGTRLIGFLSALSSITFLFSLLGRRIAGRLGAVKTKGYFWLARYLVMAPVLLTLIPLIRDSPFLALVTITLGVFGFNFFKGIAMAAEKPIQGFISRDSDRAAFISMNNIILFTGQIAMGLLMAALMGKESPLFLYGIFIFCGIIAGIFASYFTLQIPEPWVESTVPPAPLLQNIRKALSRPEFSRLLLLVMFSNLGIGMSLGFIVVYAKEVYSQPDNMVVYFTVAGAVGALSMAGILRFLTDRVGARPVYFFFNALRLLFLVLVISAPSFSSIFLVLSFLFAAFFLEQMTYWGFHATADIYFLSTTSSKDHLDLGIILNMTRGLFGMIGSLGGGFLLGWLQGSFTSAVVPFRIYFLISALFFIANIVVMAYLPAARNVSIPEAMRVILSPRGLRAVYYMNKLSRITSCEEERGIVLAMARTRNKITMHELHLRMESPSVFVRIDALLALQHFSSNRRTIELLIDQIRSHTFTTAHIAARILGEIAQSGNDIDEDLRKESEHALENALNTSDYLLKSKAAVALAYFGVEAVCGRVETMLQDSGNPREIIYFVKTLEIMDRTEMLPMILEKINNPAHAQIVDDLVLSAAGLLKLDSWFYAHYSLFLHNAEEGLHALKGELDESDISLSLNNLLSRFSDQDFPEMLTEVIAEIFSLVSGHQNVAMLHPIREFLNSRPAIISERVRYLCSASIVSHSGGRHKKPQAISLTDDL
jgi:hypothetical protein